MDKRQQSKFQSQKPLHLILRVFVCPFFAFFAFFTFFGFSGFFVFQLPILFFFFGAKRNFRNTAPHKSDTRSQTHTHTQSDIHTHSQSPNQPCWLRFWSWQCLVCAITRYCDSNNWLTDTSRNTAQPGQKITFAGRRKPMKLCLLRTYPPPPHFGRKNLPWSA